MFVDYRGNILGLLAWQWRNVVLFVTAACAAFAVHALAGDLFPKISPIPVATLGGAVGIFVSFRTNSAYQRWWEGRQLWGRLINVSRHFATQALVYLRDRPEEARALVRRHIAYTHVLRCRLRDQDALADADVLAFLSPEEVDALKGQSSPGHVLVHAQLEALFRLTREGAMDSMILSDFDESLRVVLDVQGGCERIKKTPFPRGYTFISDRLVTAFGLLLPWTLVQDMGLWGVPLSILVCFAFALISEAGRVLEDPFTRFWPALPLSALSKTIEINLRQIQGEKEVPPMPVQDARGILM
jgi:ion channel-forming bestrophin family protein